MITNYLSDRLKKLRKLKGWSQSQLAMKLNVSNKLISKWETGLAVPGVEYLQKYSELFNVSIDDLVCEDAIDFEIHKAPQNCAIDYDKLPIKKKKRWPEYLAIVICSILYAAYMLSAFTACFIVPNEQLPIWAKCLIAILPSSFILAMLIISIHRMKEIKGGEEDDSSKY